MKYRVLLTVVVPTEVEANSPEDAALNAIIETRYPVVDLPEVWNKETGEKYEFVKPKLLKKKEEED
jgi:hypothetical protein